MSSVQPDAMCGAVFCIVCNFVMFIVDAIGDQIVEANSSNGLCMSKVMSLGFALLGRGEDLTWVVVDALAAMLSMCLLKVSLRSRGKGHVCMFSVVLHYILQVQK